MHSFFSVAIIISDKRLFARNVTTNTSALAWLNFNPFKKQKLWKDEASLPDSIIRNYQAALCQFVTYDASNVHCLQNFEVIKQNTECVFAKKAKLWGSSSWLCNLSLGKFIKCLYFSINKTINVVKICNKDKY